MILGCLLTPEGGKASRPQEDHTWAGGCPPRTTLSAALWATCILCLSVCLVCLSLTQQNMVAHSGLAFHLTAPITWKAWTLWTQFQMPGEGSDSAESRSAVKLHRWLLGASAGARDKGSWELGRFPEEVSLSSSGPLYPEDNSHGSPGHQTSMMS